MTIDIDFIPVFRSKLPEADCLLPYLRRIDGSRIYSNFGPLVLELQTRLADYFRLPEGGVVCANSGTSALIAAILAIAGPASVDRPIALVPALTFVATAAAVERCGYQPYLVDVDPDTWLLEPEPLRRHCALERVGLVVPVGSFGRPVPQAPWRSFTNDTGIPVVIDGAATFASIAADPGKFVGEVPVTVSFHATKGFATGEGGAVISSDTGLESLVEQIMNFGIDSTRDAQLPGFNGKMSEYHAAIGLAELDGWIDKFSDFKSVARSYRRKFDLDSACQLYTYPHVGINHAMVLLNDRLDTERVTQNLRRNNIDCRYWYGLGLQAQTYYARTPHSDLRTTHSLLPRLLGLPIAVDLSDVYVERIVSAIADTLDSASDRFYAVQMQR